MSTKSRAEPVTGQPLLLRTSSGKQSLYVYDGTGNPIALLTDDSYQAFGYKYDPYGVPVLTQSSGGSGVSQNPYLFKTGVQDRTTGWIRFGARWYDPGTGRFTQQDTLDRPLDPANANRYAYAADDPVNNSDPTGEINFDAVYKILLSEVECEYYVQYYSLKYFPAEVYCVPFEGVFYVEVYRIRL